MARNKVEISNLNTSNIKVLTDEETKNLFQKIKEGDPFAREDLINGNLKLVLSCLKKFYGKVDNLDDLFQVGCLGLVKAIDNFNTDLDVKFSTYAVPMIIGEVRRFLRDNNSIRVSRSVRDLAYRALGVRDRILSETQQEPQVEVIARHLGENASDVAEAMEAIVEPVSLYDAVYSDGDDAVYVIDQLSDPNENDDTWVENMTLREAIARLGERERHIIKERFYLGKTQMEIAEEIGISQAQVSRLEKGAIDRIRRSF